MFKWDERICCSRRNKRATGLFVFLIDSFRLIPLKTSIVAEKSGEGVAIVINYCRYLSVN